MKQDLQTRIYKLLRQKPYSIDELASLTRFDSDAVKTSLEALKASGSEIYSKRNKVALKGTEFATDTFVISHASEELHERKFIMMSDSHIGSIQHDIDGMQETIDKAIRLGAEFALHSGDVHDGYGVYHGHLNNLLEWTVSGQVRLSAMEFGDMHDIMFYGIGGNHDYSFTMQNGARPTAMLQNKISNFKDLGDFCANIIVDGVEIRLLHGAGGNAYAQSYPAQRYLRNLAEGTPEQVPDILGLGHFHTNPLFEIYGCVVVHPSNFQGPNDFMVRRGLRGVRGLYVMTLETQYGSILSYDAKFIKA